MRERAGSSVSRDSAEEPSSPSAGFELRAQSPIEQPALPWLWWGEWQPSPHPNPTCSTPTGPSRAPDRKAFLPGSPLSLAEPSLEGTDLLIQRRPAWRKWALTALLGSPDSPQFTLGSRTWQKPLEFKMLTLLDSVVLPLGERTYKEGPEHLAVDGNAGKTP